MRPGFRADIYPTSIVRSQLGSTTRTNDVDTSAIPKRHRPAPSSVIWNARPLFRAPLPHRLEQTHARGHRDVEALHAAAQGNVRAKIAVFLCVSVLFCVLCVFFVGFGVGVFV